MKKKDKQQSVVIGAALISGFIVYITNHLRAEAGWFECPNIIFANSIAWSVFSALILGLVISVILKKKGSLLWK